MGVGGSETLSILPGRECHGGAWENSEAEANGSPGERRQVLTKEVDEDTREAPGLR